MDAARDATHLLRSIQQARKPAETGEDSPRARRAHLTLVPPPAARASLPSAPAAPLPDAPAAPLRPPLPAAPRRRAPLPSAPAPSAPLPADAAALVATAPAPALGARRRPVGYRLEITKERRQGHFAAYLTLLLTGGAVAAGLSMASVAPAGSICRQGDAPNDCYLHKVVEPGITKFAVGLLAAHLLAVLFVDVIPDARAKFRRGYRLRRDVPVAPPGAAADAMLAAACWGPVQRADTSVPASPVLRRRSVRAVCGTCLTLVHAHDGVCQECGGTVVPRRG